MESKKIVLAIDDNLTQLDIFKAILSKKYDLRVVKSASEAMSFLNKSQSDVILLDIDMPNICGFEFLTDIRKIPTYMKVPIIIVSGMTGEDFFRQARNSSAADVLSKPVESEALIKSIEKALVMTD